MNNADEMLRELTDGVTSRARSPNVQSQTATASVYAMVGHPPSSPLGAHSPSVVARHSSVPQTSAVSDLTSPLCSVQWEGPLRLDACVAKVAGVPGLSKHVLTCARPTKIYACCAVMALHCHPDAMRLSTALDVPATAVV